MKAFDLIARYFAVARNSPSIDGIVPGPVIEEKANSLLAMAVTLKVLTLTAAQRQEMSGKGDPGQRRRSEAFQGFLVKRPDFAQRLNIDPQVYQKVIDKDESYDILTATMVLIRDCASDGTLQLSAWLSDKLQPVLTYVTKLWAKNAPPELLPMRVNFGAVELGLGEQQAKATEQQARVQRKQDLVETQLADTQAGKTRLAQVDKLLHDAEQGIAEPLMTPAPKAPAHKPATKKAPAHKPATKKAPKAAKTKTKTKTNKLNGGM